MTDTSEGDALNRTILVRGFEGDERDLLRAVQDYGKVKDMKIRSRQEEVPRPRFDVGDFIGQEAKFARGTNRITSPLASLPAVFRILHIQNRLCLKLLLIYIASASKGSSRPPASPSFSPPSVCACVCVRARAPVCVRRDSLVGACFSMIPGSCRTVPCGALLGA